MKNRLTFYEREQAALNDRKAARNPLLAKPLRIIAWSGGQPIYLTKKTEDWRRRLGSACEAVEALSPTDPTYKSLEAEYYAIMAETQ